MPSVRGILSAFLEFAPWGLAFEGDRVGLQVGDPDAEVAKGVVALDRSLGAVRFAAGLGAQLLVTHHPLLWEPASSIRMDDHVGRTVLELARTGIAHVAAHTNWDCATGGVSDLMAAALRLRDVRRGGAARQAPAYKLVTFVPGGDVDRLIGALSEAGAGEIGAYVRCAFMAPGLGTFYGTEGTNPAAGQAGRIERVEEVRLEMLAPAGRIGCIERALLDAHPYEEPAYDFVVLRPAAGQGSLRTGTLPTPAALGELAAAVDRAFATRCWSWGDPGAGIERVTVAGGAAGREWRAALEAGAQAFVTGEVRHETALEATEMGLAMIAAGHYATENPACRMLLDELARAVPEVAWTLYEPPPGLHGRPC
jgi:dinuclear metal center YbgI/SA1388 family protein